MKTSLYKSTTFASSIVLRGTQINLEIPISEKLMCWRQIWRALFDCIANIQRAELDVTTNIFPRLCHAVICESRPRLWTGPRSLSPTSKTHILLDEHLDITNHVNINYLNYASRPPITEKARWFNVHLKNSLIAEIWNMAFMYARAHIKSFGNKIHATATLQYWPRMQALCNSRSQLASQRHDMYPKLVFSA